MELVRRGVFIKRHDTGEQIVSGVGFQPKLILLYGVNRTTLDMFDVRSLWCFGMADAEMSVAFNAWVEAAHGIGASRNVRHFVEGSVYVVRVGNTITERATLTSFDPDGFTLEWEDNDGLTNSTIHYLAIGGDANVKVGKFESGTTNNTAIPVDGVGFQPSCLITATVFGTGTSGGGSSSVGANIPALGITDGTNQGLVAIGSGTDNTTKTRRLQRTDRLFGILAGGDPSSLAMDGEIVSMDEDGFTARVLTAFGFSLNVYFVAIGNVSAKVGAFLQQSTTGRQDVTGVGFRPGCLFLLSSGQEVSTSIQTESRLTIGTADGLSQGCAWTGDKDAESTSINARYTTAQSSLLFAAPAASVGTSTILARASFDLFISDGFAIDWTVNDGAPRQVLYLAFLGGPANDPPVVDAGPTQEIAMPGLATMAGSATDDGIPVPLSYQWTQVSGPAPAQFDDDTDPVTSVLFPVAGIYVLRLTASDGHLSGSDEVTILNAPPSPGTIRRMRRAPHLANENQIIGFDRFELHLETGLGLPSGQGSDPQVMLRYSNDGGQTWGAERWASAGKQGAYRARVAFQRLGAGRDRVFEVTVSDPIPWRLIDAYLSIRGGTS